MALVSQSVPSAFIDSGWVHVPSTLLRDPQILDLRPMEVLLILHACNTPVRPGDKLPMLTLRELVRLTGMSRSVVHQWKKSLEKKGFLKTTLKYGEDGRTLGVFWDLTPLWDAVAALSVGSTASIDAQTAKSA